MKESLHFLVFLFLFPTAVCAQLEDSLLVQVSAAIVAQDWNGVDNLFSQAVKKDAAKAETFFWKEVESSCVTREKMALTLAQYYKSNRKYDKAYSVYCELGKMKSHNINYLAECGSLAVLEGKEKDALEFYEQVLTLNINHLDANIYIGNYYYFKANKKKEQIENEYDKIKSPTRMQYGHYRTVMNDLVNTDYAKAKIYLTRVLADFPSTEVKKILEEIYRVEKEANK